MISNPKCGWCEFTLGNFTGTPSYLTDAPVNLLEAFIDYHTKGCGATFFDEEGTEFSLLINPYSVYIIEDKEKAVLHDFSDMNIRDLEKELISDIENDSKGWGEFTTGDTFEEFISHENEIKEKIDILNGYTK